MIAVAVALSVSWVVTCAVALRLGLAWLEARKALAVSDAAIASVRAEVAELREKLREVERGLVRPTPARRA